jgi:hypothetical protein
MALVERRLGTLSRNESVGWLFAIPMTLLVASGVTSCKERNSSGGYERSPDPPDPPIQQPVLRDYDGEQQETLDGIRTLNTLKKSIDHDYQSWKRADPSRNGPSFGVERDALTERLIDKCTELERRSDDLLGSDAVESIRGARDDLRRFVQFARDIKAKVRKDDSAE